MVGSVIVNLLRGTSKIDSVIGIERCSTIDWIIFAFFLLYSFSITYIAVVRVRKEQIIKKRAMVKTCSSDIEMTGYSLFKLVFWAFFGGWISGALGLGGGAIYNPLLLGFGVPPSVTTATGMYMILISTTGSSLIFLIYHMLDLGYGMWIGAWCCLGGVMGLYLMKKMTQKYDR